MKKLFWLVMIGVAIGSTASIFSVSYGLLKADTAAMIIWWPCAITLAGFLLAAAYYAVIE